MKHVDKAKAAALDRAAEKLHAVFDEHMSQFSPEEQERRWDKLENHLNAVRVPLSPSVPSNNRGKHREQHSTVQNSRLSPAKTKRF